MNIENFSGYTLQNLNKINILLGKNGCGKSTLLRMVNRGAEVSADYDKTGYITPERGGALTYEAGYEQNIFRDKKWLSNARNNVNQQGNFRQQSTALFGRLERLVLREVEIDRKKEGFDFYVNKINSLLDNIYIKREKDGLSFEIYDKESDTKLEPNQISSGESELISLGIELLSFSKDCDDGKENILFLDEPDVHLHPDLQVRLMVFLQELVETVNAKIIIATHSTAILGALSNYEYTHVAFMQKGNKDIKFKRISEIYRKILPVFGAHPLSNLFNEAPVFIVEGEDDERIWQQAVRTSLGKIKIYPCACDGISEINPCETEVANIINSVYDKSKVKAYSLRDSDGVAKEIDNTSPIIRMRLKCRNAENLLLANEVLETLSITWDELKTKIDKWISKNESHGHYSIMKKFQEEGYDRKNFDIKDVRNDLMHIIGSQKPWEVAVGQTIGRLTLDMQTDFSSDGSIYNFFGEKLATNILPSISG